MKYNDCFNGFVREDGTVAPLEEVPREDIMRVLETYKDRSIRYRAEMRKYERMIDGARALVKAVGL